MSIISNPASGDIVHMPADAVQTEHPEGDWHALSIEDVLHKLDSHESGLSNDDRLSAIMSKADSHDIGA